MNGPAQPPSPLVERLGPYELIEPLGVGGMAEVHRARDTRLGREVAVKILDFEAARQPARLRLFEQEARAAGALDHPAIVAVHDVGREGDVPYVVMELVEGETLERRLLRGRLPVRKAVEVAVQIGRGLAAAHARGILHNDLKPANVILTADGRVKILDFGLAGLRAGDGAARAPTGGDERSTLTQSLFGTPGYIAPERIAGAAADARSDVFALGAVLYEMLAGAPAFPGTGTAEILTATSERDPPPIDPPLPPPLERIVHRALEKRPAERFQSASDLAYALEAVGTVTGTRVSLGRRPGRWWLRRLAVLAAAPALLAAGLLLGRSRWERPLPSFQRLTFQYGAVASARFASDGHTVIYAAIWQGNEGLRLYTTRTDARGSAEIGLGGGDVAAVSSTGELAFFPGLRPFPALYQRISSPGETLARVPITGGAPREVLPDVVAADWSPKRRPDGETLAVVREHNGIRRLEFPIGHLIYQSSYGLRAPRFSPRGDRIAIFENRGASGDCVSVVDLDGRQKVLAEGLTFTSNTLAWSGDGTEIWFSAEKLADGPRSGGWRPALRAVTLTGRERIVVRLPEFLSLQDLAPDGRVLVTVGTLRSEVLGRPPGEPRERNLSWHEGSSYTELSRDGRKLLFFEAGELATYLRPTDGGPAVRLCEGIALGLSPDGRWVVRIGMDQYTGHVLLVPTQAGEPRSLRVPAISPWAAQWFQDGRRLLISGNEQGRPLRAWVVDTELGSSRALTPEGIGCWLVAPDGLTLACARPESGEGFLYPVDGGLPRPIPGFLTGDHMRQWSADGRKLFVSEAQARPARVFTLDLQTGRRELWHAFTPEHLEGAVGTIDPAITPDGSAWAYAVLRHLNDLYLVGGVQ
ncbi:MAG TPA: protein kinase [Vicinamibacteria bacterium]|nr:protein kinase [Vicinamibacteria bacterium]